MPNFAIFLCMLHVAMAKSSSDGAAIRYVLSVLWMTSYFYIMGPVVRIKHEVRRMAVPVGRQTTTVFDRVHQNAALWGEVRHLRLTRLIDGINLCISDGARRSRRCVAHAPRNRKGEVQHFTAAADERRNAAADNATITRSFALINPIYWRRVFLRRPAGPSDGAPVADS